MYYRAGTDPAFTIRISVHNNGRVPRKLLSKIYDLFALKYTVLHVPHLFAVINCNRCLYKQHWSIYRSFCSLKAKKAGNTEQYSYQPPFYCNFDFTCLVSAHACTCSIYNVHVHTCTCISTVSHCQDPR